MRIAVISDTHDRYPPKLPGRLRDADEIWHLGDVCAPETLVEFEQLGPPLCVVRGNGDAHPWPLALDLERGGVRFHLTHIPPRHAPDFAKAASGRPAIPRVILHGHTHVARDETDPRGVRWLNPGAISRPRDGGASFAWLTIEHGRVSWKLAPL
jgi:putative phosphoesterase